MLTVHDLIALLEAEYAADPNAVVLMIDDHTSGAISPVADEVISTRYPIGSNGSGKPAVMLRSVRSKFAAEPDGAFVYDVPASDAPASDSPVSITEPVPMIHEATCTSTIHEATSPHAAGVDTATSSAGVADPSTTIPGKTCPEVDDGAQTALASSLVATIEAAVEAAAVSETAVAGGSGLAGLVVPDALPDDPAEVCPTIVIGEEPPALTGYDVAEQIERLEAGEEEVAAAPESAPEPPPAPASVLRPLPIVVSVPPGNWLTNSRMKTARRCKKEHDFYYNQGFRSLTESDATRFGDLIHKSLEAWYRSPDNSERFDRAMAALEDARVAKAATRQPVDPYDLAKARALIAGYHVRWIDEPYEVLAVEVEFSGAPLVNPDTGEASTRFARAGKIDVLLRDLRDGDLVVMDHKTSGENVAPGSPYWTRLRIDHQVSTYFDGANFLGYGMPARWVHDVLAKPGIRPLKATPADKIKVKKNGEPYAGQRLADETPDEYFARVAESIAEDPAGYYIRGAVVRLEKDMERFRRDVWEAAEEIAESIDRKRHPRNPDACERYSSTCAFFAACTGEADIDDPVKFRRVDPNEVHAELAAKVATGAVPASTPDLAPEPNELAPAPAPAA